MTTVQQRCVFYVSGFDPKGAAHYHALYQAEAAKQSRLNGWLFSVGQRQRRVGGNSFWQIKANNSRGGAQVNTHYEFMRWDDVVRKNWPTRTGALWRDVLHTTLFNLRHGSLWRMFKLSWPPAVALFAPFVWLLLMLLAAPVTALALGSWTVAACQWPTWAGAATAALAGLALLGLGRAAQARYSMYWLTRSYAFTARQARQQAPELEARLDVQAARLVQRLTETTDDEVLLVAHSSGCIMAVCILARACQLLKALPPGDGLAKRRLSLMTLGQCIPLLAELPHAHRFRAELTLLGQTQWIDWIDFSAPPDACCFALCNPLAKIDDAAINPPKMLSPRFAQMFDAARYQALRKDKLQMHFQYLMAHERVLDYDYFLITAGDQLLKNRFAHAPSVTDFSALHPFRWKKR